MPRGLMQRVRERHSAMNAFYFADHEPHRFGQYLKGRDQ
jgi:hypothetical protein